MATAVAEVTGQRAYQPHGAALAMFKCKDREVLLDGPVRTGKTLANLTKLYSLCEKYPGIRGLIVRETRESLSETGLVTWEDQVVPEQHPILTKVTRNNRQAYHFPNGSEVVVGGMDNAQKIMSGEYDIIVVIEAVDLAEEVFSQLTTRNVRYHMPYNQILMDCNPSVPTHWLKKRFERGDTTRFQARFEDNPKYWDIAGGDWTPAGRELIATLDKLPPMMRKRLRDGLWVAAEGAIYDCFDADRDVIAPFDIPAHWPRRVGLDFGGQHTCALFFATDPITEERVLYREYLEGGRTARQHAFFLKIGEPDTLKVAGGSASEGQWRQEFQQEGMTVEQPVIRDVALGITRVYGLMAAHRVKVFDTCRGFLEQVADYRYKRDSAVPGEIENKHQYHYMDAARYILSHGSGLGADTTTLHQLKRQGVYA